MHNLNVVEANLWYILDQYFSKSSGQKLFRLHIKNVFFAFLQLTQESLKFITCIFRQIVLMHVISRKFGQFRNNY